MFLLGDVHGEKSLFNSFLNSQEKICLQLGDFGFCWESDDLQKCKFMNLFEKNYPNKMILTILGNHENYELIKRFPIVPIMGGKARRMRANIYALERGEVFEIEGYNCLALGGADSLDRYSRTEGVDWWRDEGVNLKNISMAIKNVHRKAGGHVDFVFTHCLPYRMMHNFLPDQTIYGNSEHLLDNLMDNPYVSFDEWYAGHIHATKNYRNFHTLGIGKSLIIPPKQPPQPEDAEP